MIENKRRLVGEVQKNSYTQIRVEVNSFKDRDFISVREFKASRETGEYFSTNKGFTLPVGGGTEEGARVIEELAVLLRKSVVAWEQGF